MKQDENKNKGGTPKLKNSLIKWFGFRTSLYFTAVVG